MLDRRAYNALACKIRIGLCSYEEQAYSSHVLQVEGAPHSSDLFLACCYTSFFHSFLRLDVSCKLQSKGDMLSAII